MALSGEELATLACADHLVDVGDRREPEKSLPIGLAHQGTRRSMTAAYSRVNIL